MNGIVFPNKYEKWGNPMVKKIGKLGVRAPDIIAKEEESEKGNAEPITELRINRNDTIKGE
jgi:hypothetical protein